MHKTLEGTEKKSNLRRQEESRAFLCTNHSSALPFTRVQRIVLRVVFDLRYHANFQMLLISLAPQRPHNRSQKPVCMVLGGNCRDHTVPQPGVFFSVICQSEARLKR